MYWAARQASLTSVAAQRFIFIAKNVFNIVYVELMTLGSKQAARTVKIESSLGCPPSPFHHFYLLLLPDTTVHTYRYVSHGCGCLHLVSERV